MLRGFFVFMSATEVTHNFFELKPLWVGKIGASGVSSPTATTIPLSSPIGLSNGNAYIATINRTDATGNTKYPANQRETFIGKLSGSTFIECVRGVEGIAQAWEANTVIEILVTATGWNKLLDGLTKEHNEDGTHKSTILDSLRATGAEIITGTSDTKVVTPKALADAGIVKDTDITLSANSNDKIPTQKAVKEYVDSAAGSSNWSLANDQLVYVSATSFRIVGVDRTSIYSKGTRIRYKQGGDYKYAVVTNSVFYTNTTVTIWGGNEYSLANNQAITNVYYSHIVSPTDFPVSFSYTPASGNFTVGNGVLLGRASIVGSLCHFQCSLNLGTTSSVAAGQLNFGSLPVACRSQYYSAFSVLIHSWGANIFGATCGINADFATTGISQICLSNGIASNVSPITWKANDQIIISGTYEI